MMETELMSPRLVVDQPTDFLSDDEPMAEIPGQAPVDRLNWGDIVEVVEVDTSLQKLYDIVLVLGIGVAIALAWSYR